MASGKLTALCSALLLAFCLSPKAEAAYTLTVSQSGSNVVASGSGSINTTALTDAGPASWFAEVYPSFSFGSMIAVGPTSSVGVNNFISISGPASFGSGPQVLASSGSGTLVAVMANSGFELASSYVSGSGMSGTATWNSQTLASLGLTPGTYTWTWGSGETADSFTLIIVSPVPATPVPSSLYLGIAGIVGLGLLQLFRMRRIA